MEAAVQARIGDDAQATRLRSLYTRLPVNRWRDEIRLLKIHPGHWNESISCSLKVRSLDEVSSFAYSALSYVWGPEFPKVAIEINGHVIQISANLHAALRRLRAHNIGHFVTLFADALCIDQTNIIERNHQVTLMGRVYSRCAEVVVWLGEIEKASQSCFTMNYTSVAATESSRRHLVACQCKQKQWLASADFRPTHAPPNMVTMAAPILLRLAKAKRCEDYLACHLFDTFEEMIAFRFLMPFISNNVWFKRMWTVQEGLLAGTGSLYLGAVAVPLEVLFDIATAWDIHRTQGCCRTWMIALGSVVAPVAKASFFLGKERRRVREGQDCDLFAMRIEYTNRRASLDVDLLYGLLGVTKSKYEILPDYNKSVEAVYTEVSKHFLSAFPKYLSFWIFIYAPLKNRYTSMPSWAVDWTTLEISEYQNGRYTWTGLHYMHEVGRLRYMDILEHNLPNMCRDGSLPTYFREGRTSLATYEVTFHDNAMILSAAYVDTIDHIGEVVDHMDSPDWYARFRKVVDSWRALVLAHHGPQHNYQPVVGIALPIGFALPKDWSNSQYSTWEMAWLKVLCAGVTPSVGRTWYQLMKSDIAALLQDATHDEDSPLLLKERSQLRGHESTFAESRAKMIFPRLYQQVLDFLPQLLEGKRIFMTSHGYLGFGNINTSIGDEIYLPTTCMAPIILRPTQTSKQSSVKNIEYTIVSACHMQAFGESLYADFESTIEQLRVI